MNTIGWIMWRQDQKRRRNFEAMTHAQRDEILRQRIHFALRMAKQGDPTCAQFLRSVLLAEISSWPNEDIVCMVERLESLPRETEQPPQQPTPMQWFLLSLTEPWVWLVNLIPARLVYGPPELDEVCEGCGCLGCVCDEIAF